MFCGAHLFQIYLKYSEKDDLEDESLSDEDKEHRTNSAFAAMLIACGELLVVICITFLNAVTLRNVHLFRFLLNQIIAYNKLTRGNNHVTNIVHKTNYKEVITFLHYHRND